MKKLILALFLLLPVPSFALTPPTITATAKGPNQINLTWAAASAPGYGYLVEIQSAGDSRYTSFTEWVPIPSASGDATDQNTDPTCAFCYQPPTHGLDTWVVEAQYIDPQDGTAAQAIIYRLKPNTSYNFRVRTYQGYLGSTFSVYSNTATVSTLNFVLRYVNTATGNDANGGTNSTSDAWLTINHASAVVTAGQCVLVMAGNYANDRVNIQSATGSSGSANKIVIMANPGDTVTITSTISGTAAYALNTSYVVVDGINSTVVPAGTPDILTIAGDHNAVFGGNVDVKNLIGGKVNGDHNLVQGMYIHDAGLSTVDAGNCLNIIGSNGAGAAAFNIFQYNHLTRCSHSTIDILNVDLPTAPNHNQVQDNYMDGGWGIGTSALQFGGNTSTNHNLYEGNRIFYVFMNPGNADFKEPLVDDGTFNTMRRNVSVIGGSNGLELNSFHGDQTDGLYYNNIFYKMAQRCWWIAANGGGIYTRDNLANNICVKGGTTPDGVNGQLGMLEWFYTAPSSSSLHFNDVLYYLAGIAQPSQQVIRWTDATTNTVATADGTLGPLFSSNVAVSVAPQFVSEAGFDFHLLPTSPLVGAGTSVTDATWGTITNSNLGAFDGSFTPVGTTLAPGSKVTSGVSLK